MDPNFVPEFHFFDELAKEDQDEVLAESSDVNHPIEIEAEPKSLEE